MKITDILFGSIQGGWACFGHILSLRILQITKDHFNHIDVISSILRVVNRSPRTQDAGSSHSSGGATDTKGKQTRSVEYNTRFIREPERP